MVAERTRRRNTWVILVLVSVVSVGCGRAAAPAPEKPAAGVEQGKQLVATKAQPACGVCHAIPGVAGATGAVGPSLAGVGTRVAARVPGKPAEVYLRESLTDPNAYVVPGFLSPSPMPSYREQLSARELDDIVAFLLTLR